MGHSVGISDSYYRITEELLKDYLKAIKNLTINGNNIINETIEKEFEELRKKNMDNEYALKAKSQKDENALTVLSDQVMMLMKEVQVLKNGKT